MYGLHIDVVADIGIERILFNEPKKVIERFYFYIDVDLACGTRRRRRRR
jgi:hypothetical protein